MADVAWLGRALRAVDEWELTPAEAAAVIGDLGGDSPERIASRQHDRIQAITMISSGLWPVGTHSHVAPGPILRHPRTGPSGDCSALTVMCEGAEGMQSVAAHFHRLPFGPLLLPGVLADLAADGLVEPDDVLQNLVQAQEQSRWMLDIDVQAHREYAGVVAALQHQLSVAPVRFRNDVFVGLLTQADPVLVSWASEMLATDPGTIE